MENYKLVIKDIHEFVEKTNIQSFHCVAYGILPNITLIEIHEPKFHIILNTKFKEYIDDMKLLKKRFPSTPIIYEHYDPALFVKI